MTDLEITLRDAAKEDVELLQAEGSMAITNCRQGVLWLTVEGHVMIASDGQGTVLYQTGEDNLMIDFIADSYTVGFVVDVVGNEAECLAAMKREESSIFYRSSVYTYSCYARELSDGSVEFVQFSNDKKVVTQYADKAAFWNR